MLQQRSNVPSGCDLIFIFNFLQDEGSLSLGAKARTFLASFGSMFVTNLKYRDCWTFIAWKGQRLNEDYKRAKSINTDSWGEPIITKVKIPLKTEDLATCEWSQQSEEERTRRERFCSLYEGYAHLCDCMYLSCF